MNSFVAMLALLATLTSSVTAIESTAAPSPPPVDGDFDYQIGGPYEPYDETEIVSRDRLDPPVPGLYNICYINAFQTQAEDFDWWVGNHNNLLLKKNGEYVEDSEWNEILLAIGTKRKRTALVKIVRPWIEKCAADGFDAVEFDNLDSWTRSQGLLIRKDAKRYVRRLNAIAAAAGLASGQKNTPQLSKIKESLGFSFAIAEECNRYRECARYTNHYGDNVIIIEYRRKDFNRACAKRPELATVLRDRLVRPKDKAKHVYDSC